MTIYSQAFEQAVNRAMLFEIGGWWNLNKPGAKEGWITTPDYCKACGYVNDPIDKGGETKYGISKKANPNIDIIHLDWEGAKSIYYSHYWLNCKCDRINGRIGALHFDSAIQHGATNAAKFIQRAIGVIPDGAFGPGTIAVLNTKNPISICNSVCDQRIKYYNDIVVNNPIQQKFLSGWLHRVEEMRLFVTNPLIQF